MHVSARIACDESGAECATAREGGNEGATGWVTLIPPPLSVWE